MKTDRILVCGDIHGNFNHLNTFMNKHMVDTDIILQCGDFGYWPKEKFYKLQPLKNKNIKIFWCDGNHEDHNEIKRIDESGEIHPNVYYMKRGSVLVLPDGRKVLFIGGGLSIDKQYRVEGFDWFPEETITESDLINLPDDDIDIVISHTAPAEFNCIDRHLEWMYDRSRDALSYVLKKYRPKLWYFAHMHLYKEGVFEGCKWTCLGAICMGHKWYCELEEK